MVRREDDRFITGRGRYVNDIRLEGMLHAAFLRSPHAHARIEAIHADVDLGPGVVAVLTGAEWTGNTLPHLPADGPVRRHGATPPETPHYPLARDRVRLVGDPVAMVIARTPALAADAAERIEVAYSPLPAVASVAAAIEPGAAAIWDEAPDNVGYSWSRGDDAAIDEAIASAHHVVRARLSISRVTAAPMEPRGAIGAVEDGRMVLRCSHQRPYPMREGLAAVFGVDTSDIRVVAPDVGGSFGLKGGILPEDVAVLWAARETGRPVSWTSSRSEAFLADPQARGIEARTELALDADGRFLAFRVRFDTNIGAYMEMRSLPPINNIGGIAGVYVIPHIGAHVRGILTNTLPTSPYRGAGRPEATYALEHSIDRAARDLGIDRFELRRRNLIPPDAMPYDTRFVFTYDCGEFAGNMDAAASMARIDTFEDRRAEAKRRGRLRGLGFSNPIEVAGGPYRRPGRDFARLTLRADGGAVLECGAMSVGQGLETVMTRLASLRTGLAQEAIEYRQGDTDQLPGGRGSGGSAGLSSGGGAVSLAIDDFIRKAREAASDELEAAVDDIVFEEGRLKVAGTDRAICLAELARKRGESGQPDIAGDGTFQPEAATFPNGCHVCEVEIDPETGAVEVVDYVSVEDIGRVIDPVLVEGQIHGGVAQGAGQALKERIVVDANGEVITGSFNDYAMPRADDMPTIRSANREVPTATNPLGAKGVGEAGTVGALAAVMSAITDALAPVGVEHIDMPATPDRVWAAIRQARKAS